MRKQRWLYVIAEFIEHEEDFCTHDKWIQANFKLNRNYIFINRETESCQNCWRIFVHACPTTSQRNNCRSLLQLTLALSVDYRLCDIEITPWELHIEICRKIQIPSADITENIIRSNHRRSTGSEVGGIRNDESQIIRNIIYFFVVYDPRAHFVRWRQRRRCREISTEAATEHISYEYDMQTNEQIMSRTCEFMIQFEFFQTMNLCVKSNSTRILFRYREKERESTQTHLHERSVPSLLESFVNFDRFRFGWRNMSLSWRNKKQQGKGLSGMLLASTFTCELRILSQ